MRVTLCACLAVGLARWDPVEAATPDGLSTERASDARLWTVGIRWENDTFADQDQFYSNGMALWLAHTGPSWADLIMDWLPWYRGRRTVTYSLKQAMFTPRIRVELFPTPRTGCTRER